MCLHDPNTSAVGQALVLLSNPTKRCSRSRGSVPLEPRILLPCHLTGLFPGKPHLDWHCLRKGGLHVDSAAETSAVVGNDFCTELTKMFARDLEA